MKCKFIISVTVALILVIKVATFCIMSNTSSASGPDDGKPFYVGVTYCGDNLGNA